LYARLARFAAFIRCDAAGIPAIYRPGDLFLVRSSERRASGTHYTPHSITEPVVRYTLEPLVYEGPDEGWPEKDWRLRSAKEILALRVCDIACGSGAFLLQACRYLAERLIESEGNLASHPTPARLRIAQHCLYGVDQNAGAVEVAKLSLWLLTAARDEPFTFLNQALHSGDSLVGAVDGPLVNQPTPPAHWNALNWWQAFPAVMQQQGFDAIIGNPPFVGGRKIRRALGGDYLRYLTTVAEPGGSGNADLCAYFFRRAFRLCNARGKIGFVATNSIAEGDTRATGLEQILHWGGVIYRADDDYPWPGVAAVTVAIVHLSKSPTRLPRWLDGAGVAEIKASLQAFSVTEHKRSLPQNERLCYQGSVLAAKGFILTADEAALMLASDPANAAVIVPYYTGDEVFNSATLVPQRYVIDFRDWSLEQASRYLEPFRRVQETVFPVRQRVNRKSHRERWWQYGDKRPALYAALSGLQETLVQLRHAKYLCPQFAPTNGVFSESTVVFPTDQIEMFALLNSIIHAAWARETSGSLGTEMRYTPRDCFFTFPLPPVRQSLTVTTVGQQLRSAIDEIKQSRNCGITEIYNLFHSDHVRSADIQSLRELHQKLDHAIATLYSWDDLIFARAFVRTKLGMRWTIPDHLRKIVLTRLLELNHSLSKSLPQ
jgi:methylase of polypeptide subunit release factors